MSNRKETTIEKRATDAKNLVSRLSINKSLQRKDFKSWLFKRIPVKKGWNILDVGCGTGYQTKEFATLVGSTGSVCAFDISEDSIKILSDSISDKDNVDLHVGDMDKIDEIVAKCRCKEFDLVHSSYAIYYAKDPIYVMSKMKEFLSEKGVMAIFVPRHPNGMVEFARRFHEIPDPVDYSLSFYKDILEPFFLDNFEEIEAHFFKNDITICSPDEFMSLYEATTYYNPEAASAIRESLLLHFKTNDSIKLDKNGYLIMGKKTTE